MFSLLIALVYLAFIALGLPDSLLGASWPVISQQFGVDKGLQGVITMIIAGGTVVSSLLSDKLTRKFGTGLLTAISVLLTCIALFGFSFCNAFWQMCLWAIPYGLGAGAVDAALNNYAAVHFSSKHLNWLHCFWGVGACISPYIMGGCLSGGLGWSRGYFIVGILQAVVSLVLFVSLPIWKKTDKISQNQPDKQADNDAATDGANNCDEQNQDADSGENVQTFDLADDKNVAKKRIRKQNSFTIKGVWQTLAMFACYCSAESIAMQWSSSYLVYHRGVSTDLAATFASMFFLGITFGRFLCGLVSNKLGDKKLIRLGIAVMVVAVVAISLPVKTDAVALAGLVLFGFGCAPIYPTIIHQTPQVFGQQNSQSIVGLQMAFAYLGTTFMPLLFGLVASSAIWTFPLFIGAFTLMLFGANEYFNKVTSAKA